MDLGWLSICINYMVHCTLLASTVQWTFKPSIQLPSLKGMLYMYDVAYAIIWNFFEVHIHSEHAVSFIKGWFQSLQGLRQQINSEQEYGLALAWVWACIIIHSLTACYETDDEEEFWQWIEEGLKDQCSEGRDGHELGPCEPVCEQFTVTGHELLGHDLWTLPWTSSWTFQYKRFKNNFLLQSLWLSLALMFLKAPIK